MCVAVRQPPVVRGAQPQPGRRRHRSIHHEGDVEGEGDRGRCSAGAAARRSVVECVGCCEGPTQDTDGEARHPTTDEDDPKPFLRHDSGQNARDRVVVFATDESLRALCRANTWYMDGNISLVPAVFEQLYVIRAPLGTTCISCVYALLPGKTEAVYTQMLEAFTDACTALGFNADPTTVVTDFEMAAMHAVTAVFGQQVHVQGCFFHFCQSTRRHIQDLGLSALYIADDVTKHFVGMLDGLALLPLADVPGGMAHLRANTPSTSTTSSTTLTPLSAPVVAIATRAG